MSHIQFTDELVREYLLFRGFGGALKAFDADLKLDKDKGFRVDKIVDQILQHIYNYDLTGLRETWNHFDTRLFIRLEQHFASSVRKLENSVLKFYLVNASENNKPDKITEFFTKLANDLSNQNEWKDWFVLPFIKNPEEHPTFGVYFSRHWQDTLIVSLHNFLAAVYQCMPLPTLASFEENATKMAALQKENEIIRKGLINLISSEGKLTIPEPNLEQSFEGIKDDFFNIAQEIKANASQTKLLKTIMKNIGSMPTSPKTESKDLPNRSTHRKHSSKKVPQAKRSLSIDARPTHLKPRERDSSLDITSTRTNLDTQGKKEETNSDKLRNGNFLFLSREEFSEHKSQITTTKFNSPGNLVASTDLEGELKVWSTSPSCKTISSFSCKSAILCLEWLPCHERYLVYGTTNGLLTLYDIIESKAVWNLNVKGENPSVSRIEDLVVNPVDSSVVLAIASGKIFPIDLRSKKIEKSLHIQEEATCAKMNHNGQFVVIGTLEGNVLLLDLRKNNVIEKWAHHQNPVIQLEITADYTHVYSLCREKICCKSLNQAKSKPLNISVPDEMKVHPKMHGKLFCLESTSSLLLAVGVNSGVIYKISDSNIIKNLELGGHKTMLTCVDWSFANQCATCVTASQDGKIKISTLLVNSL